MRSLVCGVLLALHAAGAFAQTATVRIEVRSDAGPVRDADVVINGTTYRTAAQGVVVVTLPPGQTDIVVVKEGFAPAAVSVDLQASQQQRVVIELNRGASVEEHVTVSATRTEMPASGKPTVPARRSPCRGLDVIIPVSDIP